VRVTVVDGKVEAVALRGHEPNGTPILDIRRNNMTGVIYERIILPQRVENILLELVSSYQLRFAAVDFGVDKSGRWYFFEINPNGQWAWLDLIGAVNIGNLFLETFLETKRGRK
jgi:glutathione synthase/RimK-type ligase-like ATP-grasp enzyme